MATRKELIEQARADQRSRSALARADNPKSAIVGIGDRDPLTGQYQVMLPDGSVEMGEKQFNSSLPKGSQVLGVPQSGGWLLDERDVQPIAPTLQPSTMGKIKVLFSTIEGSDRVFWVGGDRPKPKKIHSIPVSEIVDIAQISNANENFYVQLRHYSPSSVATKITISAKQKWVIPSTPLSPLGLFYGELVAGGNGFWTQSFIATASNPITSINDSVTSRSQFLGIFREITGGVYTYNQSSSTEISVVTSAISPVIDKTSQHFSNTIVNRNEYNQLVILGKNALSCMYFFIDSEALLETATLTRLNYNLRLTGGDGSQETILGGDLGFRQLLGGSLYAYPVNLFNLIGNQIYMVNLGIEISPFNFATLTVPDSAWKPTQSKNLAVDIYRLGTNTTKRSITSKVFAIKPNAQVHSLSYHP